MDFPIPRNQLNNGLKTKNSTHQAQAENEEWWESSTHNWHPRMISTKKSMKKDKCNNLQEKPNEIWS